MKEPKLKPSQERSSRIPMDLHTFRIVPDQLVRGERLAKRLEGDPKWAAVVGGRDNLSALTRYALVVGFDLIEHRLDQGLGPLAGHEA